MFFSEGAQFTIGQFAKLHEINKKTLMWYDEIGLLKPAAVGENGYRHYTYRQSALLEVILMLRELDVPLEEIRTFLQNRSACAMEKLMEENLQRIDHRIARLRALKKIMEAQRGNMMALRTLDVSSISVMEKTGRNYLATVALSEGESFEEEIERVIAQAKGHQLRRLHDAAYGAMLPAEQLYRGCMSAYECLYIQLPVPGRKDGLHVQPEGKYLRAYCRGSWERLPDRYQELLSYAREHGLELYGYAYEQGINEAVIDSWEEYITQIEIPVRVKPKQ